MFSQWGAGPGSSCASSCVRCGGGRAPRSCGCCDRCHGLLWQRAWPFYSLTATRWRGLLPLTARLLYCMKATRTTSTSLLLSNVRHRSLVCYNDLTEESEETRPASFILITPTSRLIDINESCGFFELSLWKVRDVIGRWSWAVLRESNFKEIFRAIIYASFSEPKVTADSTKTVIFKWYKTRFRSRKPENFAFLLDSIISSNLAHESWWTDCSELLASPGRQSSRCFL